MSNLLLLPQSRATPSGSSETHCNHAYPFLQKPNKHHISDIDGKVPSQTQFKMSQDSVDRKWARESLSKSKNRIIKRNFGY